MGNILFLVYLHCAFVACDFNMRILHTNDVHAHVTQFGLHNGKCRTEDAAENRCYGGVARRQTAIRDIRNNHDNVVLLDAGDQFQGTIWFTYYKGHEVSHFMDILQYDVMVSLMKFSFH